MKKDTEVVGSNEKFIWRDVRVYLKYVWFYVLDVVFGIKWVYLNLLKCRINIINFLLSLIFIN